MSTTTTPIAFPCTAGEQIGSGYTLTSNGQDVTLEPSGLVVLSNKLYMVSDNGYLMRIAVGSGATPSTTAWTMVHNFTNDPDYSDDSDKYDLECITVATGSLMVGVEGSSKYNPHILRYDTATDAPTGSVWDLGDVTLTGGGMEAMTLVPSSACPPAQKDNAANPAYYGGDQYYGGYFFAAYQSKTGYVYVYDLPKGGGGTQSVNTHLKKFELKDGDGAMITLEASDMCFADNTLFVLFDGGGDQDELHLFSIRSDGTGLDHVAASYLPSITGVWTAKTDFEGITIDGTNLYLSVDARNSTKLVYRYTDYSLSKFT